jgi:hypothetical protein
LLVEADQAGLLNHQAERGNKEVIMQQVNEIEAFSGNRSLGGIADTAVGQHHYSADQVAKMWNLSPDTVRRLFHGEDGVLKIVRPGNRSKRTYVTLRIPESVLNRVYRRIVGPIRRATS